MDIQEAIVFKGQTSDLIWKYPGTFSNHMRLFVDANHEALFVINECVTDLFMSGSFTLSGSSSCKVFFINRSHQIDIAWETQFPREIQDPLYDVLLHISARGSISVSICDSLKFFQHIVGDKEQYANDNFVSDLSSLVAEHVLDCVSMIMTRGMLSYWLLNTHLVKLSETIGESLEKKLQERGIKVWYFNLESVEAPKTDYESISETKKRRAQRLGIL